MLQNYITVALRVAAKSKTIYLIANLGLVIGLMAALLISYYVANEVSYDDWVRGADHLYRLDTFETYPGRKPLEIARAPGPVATVLLSEIDGVEAVTRGFVADVKLALNEQKIREDALAVDPNFISEIRLDLITGNRETALDDPRDIAISEALAMKYFGRTDIIGETLTLHRREDRDYRVTAIFSDLPENSHFKFDMLLPIESYFFEDEQRNILNFWGGAYFHTYMRLRKGVSASIIEAQLPAFIDRNLPDSLARLLSNAPHEFYQFNLVNIRDLHLLGAELAAMKPAGNLAALYVLAVVAFLIMVIAAFNFSILATTQSMLRAREVALRKTHGAKARQIMAQFMGEVFTQALFAGFIASGLSEVIAPLIEQYLGPVFGPELGKGTLGGEIFLLWLFAFIGVTSLIAGLYPSLFLARLKPSEIFNPDHQRTMKAGRSRTIMLMVQVAITAGLLTVAAAMTLQQYQIANHNLGYDSEGLWVIRVPDIEDQDRFLSSFVERLRVMPEVSAVTVSSAVPGDPSEANIALTVPGATKPMTLGFHRVGADFFETYNIDLLDGHLFSRDFGADAAILNGQLVEERPIIANLSALKSFGFEGADAALGKTVTSTNARYRIVGVIPDIHFRSLKEAIRPEVYLLDGDPGSAVTVRFTDSASGDARGYIDPIWRDSFPDIPLDMTAMTEQLRSLYEAEKGNSALIIAFTFIAVLLTSIGFVSTFGATLSREKRGLAIRRVYGARMRDLAVMMARRFLVPIMIANVISWPISFYILSRWFETFETRFDIGVSPYAFATLVSLMLAGGLLSLHIRMIRGATPVKVLRGA